MSCGTRKTIQVRVNGYKFLKQVKYYVILISEVKRHEIETKLTMSFDFRYNF